MAMRQEVRKGMTQSNFNAQYAGLVPWEILIMSIAAGIYFTSWWVFLLVLVLLLLGIQMPVIGELLMLVVSVPIGAIFGFIGLMISGWGAFIVIGGLAYWITVYMHFVSLMYNRDIVDW